LAILPVAAIFVILYPRFKMLLGLQADNCVLRWDLTEAKSSFIF